ncbi:MAG: transglycosylase SLT domain-containing protein [Pyrinomonadaceae bacterium]|nr:transglycosylase SLT domain-containing protein [Pyrinomonadaceae bacterium]
MNRNFKITSRITISTLITALLAVTGLAQVTSTRSGGRSSSTPAQAAQAEARIRQITEDSGRYFKQGLYNLQDNRRSQARDDFNKSVEVFLISGVNVQRNANLRECYNQLIETVYRMEFPSTARPVNIRGLSAMCRWEVKAELADSISSIVSRGASTKVAVKSGSETGDEVPEDISSGFSDQSFEPSPLDELSKLQLNETETNVDTPELRREYEVIRVAGSNRTLGFSFQMHRLVQQYLNYYRGRGRRTMEVGLYRSGFFMTMARRIFREEGVPENVAWLGQVESAWKPTARSWAAAAGLWQFIPGTGRRYGLRRTSYIDERQSFEKATRASARYLRFLANRYGGNWELAMAGYNCGEGNVDRAIRRAGKRNFWAAYPYLPRETRNYVPNILATIIIANNPYKYGFGHVKPAPKLRYDRVRVPSSTNLSLVAQASNSSIQYLRYLNPELRTNRTPPEPYVVRIPAGQANQVVAVLKSGRAVKSNNGRLARSTKGETWQNISRRTGVSIADLKSANPGMKVPKGRVYVPVRGNGVAATNYSRPVGSVTPSLTVKGIKVVKAKAGDTVSKLAERHKVDAGDVAKLNGLIPTSKLHGGREVRIPVK